MNGGYNTTNNTYPQRIIFYGSHVTKFCFNFRNKLSYCRNEASNEVYLDV